MTKYIKINQNFILNIKKMDKNQVESVSKN